MMKKVNRTRVLSKGCTVTNLKAIRLLQRTVKIKTY